MTPYTLRTATQADLPFLFDVSTKAMLPVRKAHTPQLKLDLDKEFQEYSEKFDPKKIQIIGWNNTDVGRLRVVRSPDQIYIGGIQILPTFQKKGIGSAIMIDLIKESDARHIPIRLEVAPVNIIAQTFYEKLGFVKIGKKKKDWIMEYK
ncbi:GNAT family N-acetyltransferase [Candidatus Nomurabacteria bacterium]|nr:GNAT family N-acetyltransferase [Candidatus Nomurabacteria bacterium]